MRTTGNLRAFANKKYKYYELQEDLGGIVPKGAIFVHDTDDNVYGSIADGCLKLCWTPDGNCYRGELSSVCGGTVIFHSAFKNSKMFKPASPLHDDRLQYLESIVNEFLQKLKRAEQM